MITKASLGNDQRSRRRLCKQLVARQNAVKVSRDGGSYQLPVFEGLLATSRSRVARDAELPEYGGEVHVHVGVKQPHGRSP
jgi:hypothetical protein